MSAAVTPTALRVLVTLLAVLATVAQVAYLDAISWHVLGLASAMTAPLSAPFMTVMTGHAVVSLLAGVLAIALVLHEGPKQAAARGLGLALGAWSYLTAYSGVTLFLRPDTAAWRGIFESHFLAVELVGLIGLLRFTALFPRSLAEQSLEAPDTLPPWLHPVHRASVWMLRPFAPWLAGFLVLAGLLGLTAARGQEIGNAGLSPLMDVVRFAAAGLVVLNLRRSWGRAGPEDIARLGWLLVGLAAITGVLLFLIGGNVLVAVTGWPEPEVAWRPILLDVGLVGFLTAAAMSILYGGPVEAMPTARRLGAAATVGALGLFLAAGLEALFGGTVLGGSSLGTGVGTLVAFVIVVSTHRGLVRSVERILAQRTDLGVPS
ncbi:MAG: hypothetical protein ABL963_03375 [Longimicrobiales bacterium]